MAKAGCWSVLVPFPSHCSSGPRGCLVLTVVDASNRPRRRRRISRRIFEGPAFTGSSRSKLAPERSRPGTAGHVDWEHPMIFRSVGFRFLRAAGRDAWKRTQPSLKPSRAEPDWVFRCVPPDLCPGSRQGDETNQRGVAARSWRIWWSCFWGGVAPGYRSGMRGDGMVARTRSLARVGGRFRGGTKLARSLELFLRGRSCFAGANGGAKFGQLAQLLSEGFTKCGNYGSHQGCR